MRNISSGSEPPSIEDTSKVLKSSRDFLSQRLLPDLDSADQQCQKSKEERSDLINLRRALQALLKQRSEASSRDGYTTRQFEVPGNEKLDLKVSKDEKPIISLGLGEIFLPMDVMEAIEFIEKRLKILEKKILSQTELVAQIEAHIHLTSTSLSQLEALHSGESQSLLEDLNPM